MTSHEPQSIPEQPYDASESLLEEMLAAQGKLEGIHDPKLRQHLEAVQLAVTEVAVPLRDLHAMTHEEQLDVLDKVVDNVFDNDEMAQWTIDAIKDAREKGNEEEIKSLTARQKSRFNSMRRDIADVIGVEIEDTEKENDDYRAKLLERVMGMGDQPDEEVMRELGFLVADENGDEHFDFPEDVFPPHIVSKWRSYESTIKAHVTASSRFNRAIEDNSAEIVELDAMRRYAHNNLSKSVQEFLSLEDWDFERVRRFIAKLVEHRFPTVETAESAVTSKDVVMRLRMIHALGKMTQKLHEEE